MRIKNEAFEIVVKFVTNATILIEFVNYCNFQNCSKKQHYSDFVTRIFTMHFSKVSKSDKFWLFT